MSFTKREFERRLAIHETECKGLESCIRVLNVQKKGKGKNYLAAAYVECERCGAQWVKWSQDEKIPIEFLGFEGELFDSEEGDY